MRSILIILLFIAGSSLALAQSKRDTTLLQTRHNIYIDVSATPGFSATYTWNLTRHFDIGGGLNSYYLRSAYYLKNHSAAYLDFRPHWGGKKSLFFVFTDIGMALNRGPQPELATLSPMGLYAAFGPGYCYRINKRGMGPYLSFGMYGYSIRYRYKYPPPPTVSRVGTTFQSNGVISVGFKF